MKALWILCFVVCTGHTLACLRAISSGAGSVTDVSSGSGGESSPTSDVEADDTSNTDSGSGSDDSDNEVQLPGCPNIISRSEWGARTPKSTELLTATPSYAIIHQYGAGSRCNTEDTCKEIVRGYQNYHMDTKGWADIGYNFMVGEDGNVYEGRGWGVRGAHAGSQFNGKSLGICVIGDFSSNTLSLTAQNAIKLLLSCAESNKKLTTSYVIRGHGDLEISFYDFLKTWERYSTERPTADIGRDESSSTVQLPECPTIISRAEWGARARKRWSDMQLTPSYAVIHHSAGPRCETQSTCTTEVKSFQNLHMDTRGWADIGYNFIVGEDGHVYEGRGWGVIGAHAGKNYYNKNGIGICVIGDFRSTVPNEAAQNAIKQLLSCAVSNRKLETSYTLLGHLDVKQTECPGQSFYDLIQTWK